MGTEPRTWNFGNLDYYGEEVLHEIGAAAAKVRETIHVPEEQWHPSARGWNFDHYICPHGHDKRLVGVVHSNAYCRGCRAERKKLQRRADRLARGIETNHAYLPALKYWRTNLGFTHDRLAEDAEVNRYTINHIESQRLRASLPTRRRIAAALGVRIGDLMVQPPGAPVDLRKEPWKIRHRRRELEEAS
jgi:DNA-binding XRE family transcriptional regulator